MMTLDKLHKYIIEILKRRPDAGDAKVVIPVYVEGGTVGGTPYIEIENVAVGFDWDKGKVFLMPEKRLMKVPEPSETIVLPKESKTTVDRRKKQHGNEHNS